MLDLPELERIAAKALAEHEPQRPTLAEMRRSYARLYSFRTGCLVGIGPASIIVDGFTFHDELEAEGYLAELDAAMAELDESNP